MSRNADVPGIDPGVREAAYRQLAVIVREQITSGRILPGHAIPTRNELRETYEVGKTTVIRAMEILKEEGLIESEPGRGFFVAERSRWKR